MYAKLINGALQPAPRHVTVDGYNIWNAPAEVMFSLGWKAVVFTNAPEAPEGYHYAAGWEEDETEITQTWTLVPDDVEAGND